jgi:hypothetical protein
MRGAFFTTMPTTSNTKPGAKERPTFTVELRAEPGIDPIHALRAVLKWLLRTHGMRCIAVHEHNGEMK